MAMRLLVLGTEARYYYIRSEIPNDPHDVSKNFVMIPDAHRFVSRFGKPEVGCSREELLRMVDASRIEQFFCSNNTKPLAEFRADQILSTVPARNRKVSGGVKRTVRPERHQICVFVIGMRRDVKNAAKHVELLQCELNFARIHLFWSEQRRGIGGVGRAGYSENRNYDGCSATARNAIVRHVQRRFPVVNVPSRLSFEVE